MRCAWILVLATVVGCSGGDWKFEAITTVDELGVRADRARLFAMDDKIWIVELGSGAKLLGGAPGAPTDLTPLQLTVENAGGVPDRVEGAAIIPGRGLFLSVVYQDGTMYGRFVSQLCNEECAPIRVGDGSLDYQGLVSATLLADGSWLAIALDPDTTSRVMHIRAGVEVDTLPVDQQLNEVVAWGEGAVLAGARGLQVWQDGELLPGFQGPNFNRLTAIDDAQITAWQRDVSTTPSHAFHVGDAVNMKPVPVPALDHDANDGYDETYPTSSMVNAQGRGFVVLEDGTALGTAIAGPLGREAEDTVLFRLLGGSAERLHYFVGQTVYDMAVTGNDEIWLLTSRDLIRGVR